MEKGSQLAPPRAWFQSLRARSLIVIAALCVLPALAQSRSLASSDSPLIVQIDNPVGAVRVTVGSVPGLMIRHSIPNRMTQPDDLIVSRRADRVLIECRPADFAPIDLAVVVPSGVDVQVSTQAGAISLEGTVRNADLATDSGAIELRVPWSGTRFSLTSQQKPRQLQLPQGIAFAQPRSSSNKRPKAWQLHDKLSGRKTAYSHIRVKARRPDRLVLKDLVIPEDSRVKMQWQAPELLAGMVRESLPASPEDVHAGGKGDSSQTLTVVDGTALFTSDVRMVNLDVAVVDGQGRSIPGLQQEDFEVLEDGVPQAVDFVGADEVPFNLVLLLDCSGSTDDSRESIAEAARRFAAAARPNDRVAAYALAGGNLHILSRLTTDREEFNERLRSISILSGGTPLYDMVVLAYAEELAGRKGERNALVVITDGIDNRLQGANVEGQPSLVPFTSLREAVNGMNTLIYPIFLDPGKEDPELKAKERLLARSWKRQARSRLTDLATISGGRLFQAQSIRDLEPVYQQVAKELRSVYTIGYYPQHQSPDGSWKTLQVKLDRKGARVRSRAGYYAW